VVAHPTIVGQQKKRRHSVLVQQSYQKLSPMSTCLSTVLKFFFFIGAFVFAMTVSAPRVFASVLVEQIDYSTEMDSSHAFHGDPVQVNFHGVANSTYTFTGASGIPAFVYLYLGTTPDTINCVYVRIINHSVGFNTWESTGTSACTALGGSIFEVTSGGVIEIPIHNNNGSTSFNPAQVYSIEVAAYQPISPYNNRSSYYYGMATSSFNDGVNTRYADPLYFIVADSGGVPVDKTTRFVTINPSNASSVATTSSVGFQVYVNSNDLSSTTQVTVTYVNDNCNSTSVSAIEAVGNFSSSSCTISTTTPIFSSGFIIASSTYTWLHNGRWNYVANISNQTGTFCLFGNCLFSDEVTLATLTGRFTVNSLGAYDILTDYVASSTATDVSTDLSMCAVWTSTGDVFQCMRNLFLPSDSQWKDFFTGYSGAFLTYPPLGYITKVINILNDPTVVEPPALSYTFGSSSPSILQGKNYTIQIFDNFDKVTVFKADDGSNKDIWDIVMPYFRVVVGFAVLFVITMDIIGVGLSARGGDYTTTETGSETVSSSSLLPSGERKSFSHSIIKRRKIK